MAVSSVKEKYQERLDKVLRQNRAATPLPIIVRKPPLMSRSESILSKKATLTKSSSFP